MKAATEAIWAERVEAWRGSGKTAPEFTQDPMAFVDWGQTKLFTLDDMGEGECAV